MSDTAAYFRWLRSQIADTELYPTLRAARNGLDEVFVLRRLVRLLACGWSLERLEALLKQVAGGNDQAIPGTASITLDAVHRVAHLGPDEFTVWLAAFGGDVTKFSDEAIIAIDVWRACVPDGRVAALCAAAGLDPLEAMSQAGELGLDSSMLQGLEALAGLRGPLTTP